MITDVRPTKEDEWADFRSVCRGKLLEAFSTDGPGPPRARGRMTAMSTIWTRIREFWHHYRLLVSSKPEETDQEWWDRQNRGL
jgi:hypothetical protein